MAANFFDSELQLEKMQEKQTAAANLFFGEVTKLSDLLWSAVFTEFLSIYAS